MKSSPDTRWHKFLELANIPRVRVPELIQSNEVDMGRGFSLDELLPSVEFVRDTIRFMLYQMSIRSDADIAGYRKIHLENLGALIDPQWKEKLPYFISRDLTVVSHIAHEAAKAFLVWCRIPNGTRTRFVRRCWKYFPSEK